MPTLEKLLLPCQTVQPLEKNDTPSTYYTQVEECMSERTEPIWANFFDFAQILQEGYHWSKNVSGKGSSPSAFRVCHTSMPLQNGQKNHPIFRLENECYHSAQEWNTTGANVTHQRTDWLCVTTLVQSCAIISNAEP